MGVPHNSLAWHRISGSPKKKSRALSLETGQIGQDWEGVYRTPPSIYHAGPSTTFPCHRTSQVNPNEVFMFLNIMGLAYFFRVLLRMGLVQSAKAAPEGSLERSTEQVTAQQALEAECESCPICLEEFREDDTSDTWCWLHGERMAWYDAVSWNDTCHSLSCLVVTITRQSPFKCKDGYDMLRPSAHRNKANKQKMSCLSECA